MAKRTPFYACHQQAGAKIVDFAGWDMPLHYGSQLNEHHAVRQNVGMFDVSHMGVVDITGEEARAFLGFILANDVAKCQAGKAIYTCMLNDQGGVIDDLIVYQLADHHYRFVVNAGTRQKDIAWIQQQAKAFSVQVTELPELAILAIQGPQATAALSMLFNTDAYAAIQALKPFHFTIQQGFFIARTGYTGEAGYEIMLPAEEAVTFWQACLKANITPCGLGARDTLRLEAGLNLYGHDMDENTSPLVSNLAWTVAMADQRQFVGRDALEQEQAGGIKQQLVGLVLEGAGIIRDHAAVRDTQGQICGAVTSGGYAPTLAQSIALARIDSHVQDHCEVQIRNKWVPAKIIKPPFVRNGKKMF